MNGRPIADILLVALPDASADRLSTLFDAHYERLYRLARRPVPTTDAAADLVQDTSSPEQTGRVNRSMDSRSDVYSLGVTFYEMLGNFALRQQLAVPTRTVKRPALRSTNRPFWVDPRRRLEATNGPRCRR